MILLVSGPKRLGRGGWFPELFWVVQGKAPPLFLLSKEDDEQGKGAFMAGRTWGSWGCWEHMNIPKNATSCGFKCLERVCTPTVKARVPLIMSVWGPHSTSQRPVKVPWSSYKTGFWHLKMNTQLNPMGSVKPTFVQLCNKQSKGPNSAPIPNEKLHKEGAETCGGYSLGLGGCLLSLSPSIVPWELLDRESKLYYLKLPHLK